MTTNSHNDSSIPSLRTNSAARPAVTPRLAIPMLLVCAACAGAVGQAEPSASDMAHERTATRYAPHMQAQAGDSTGVQVEETRRSATRHAPHADTADRMPTEPFVRPRSASRHEPHTGTPEAQAIKTVPVAQVAL